MIEITTSWCGRLKKNNFFFQNSGLSGDKCENVFLEDR
jgi:hypothetical protein